MEGLQIYPTTKLCYKRQDHVLGIEIGREDFGVNMHDFKISDMASDFPSFVREYRLFIINYPVKYLYAKCFVFQFKKTDTNSNPAILDTPPCFFVSIGLIISNFKIILDSLFWLIRCKVGSVLCV